MDLKQLVTAGDVEGILREAPRAAKADLRAALKFAVKSGKVAAVKALVDAGAKPHPDSLFNAILTDHPGKVEAALAMGLSPTADLGWGDPPVMLAIDRGKTRSLRVMLDHGVSPDWAADGQEPLLHFAVRRERINGPGRLFANALAKAMGTQLNIGDGKPIVDLLIERGADLHATHNGQSALAVAVIELGEDSDRVAMLRRLGASEAGVVAHKLWKAVDKNDAAALDALLATSPPPGELALALDTAVRRDDRALVERLLKHGADLKATPVVVAAVRSRLPAAQKVELVKWLLGRGADVNARDHMDAAALEWAQADGQHEVLEVLRAAGATMPRRIDYAAARGLVEPGGNESSLCVLGPAAEVAGEIAAATGGSVITDVYRARCRPRPKALLVVQLKGHPWSHVLPMYSSWDLEEELGTRLRRDVLYYSYGKASEAYGYTLWRGGAVAESYEHYDGVKFTSTLGTRPPPKKANPVRVIDKAFKRLDAWAIECGLTARPRGEEAVVVDLVGIEPRDVAGAHVVEGMIGVKEPPWIK